MSSNSAKCIRCHPPDPGDIPLSGPAHFICDHCMQDLNHPRPHSSPATPPATSPEPDERKSSRKRGRKKTALATALVLMLLPFVGCTLHRECALDIEVDPSALRLVPSPPPANAYPRDLPGGMES